MTAHKHAHLMAQYAKRGMNMELTDYEARIIHDFIGQHWTRFLSLAEQHDMCEGEAEDLVNKLEKIAFQ